MLRFQRGDRGAFEELVRRNTPKMHSLVYRFLGDAGAADDVVQEAFIRVFNSARSYRPTARFSTWIYRIVANLCFNILRSRRRNIYVTLETPDKDDQDAFNRDVRDIRGESPQASADAGELKTRVAQAIGGLPENQKIAVILHSFERKSYEEIAEVIGSSTMAVKSLLSRARENLRDRLIGYVKKSEK